MRRGAAAIVALLVFTITLDALARRARRRRVVKPIQVQIAKFYPNAIVVSNDTLRTTDSMTTVYNFYRNISLVFGKLDGWKVMGHFSPKRSDWMYFSLRKGKTRAFVWLKSNSNGTVTIKVLPLGIRPDR